MNVKKKLFYGIALVYTGALFGFGINANASVLVQGSEMSDTEYEDLLKSVPEGHELVSNEEYDAMNNQRARSGLFHNAHVQSYGWIGVYSADYYAGITGKSKRLEALQLNILNLGTTITYRMHVQNHGWQSWRSNGVFAGTIGKSLRTEAIQITTSGLYGVSYRAHVQSYGWLGWTSSGQTSMFGNYAGTTGQSKRLEALEFKLYRQTL